MKKNSKFDSPAPASKLGRHLKDSQKVTLEEADQRIAEDSKSGDSENPLFRECITPDSTKPTREPGPLAQTSDGTITQPPKKKGVRR